MNWNFNMDEAPLNRTIVTASKCGKVILSRWVKEGSRWNMYTPDHPPLAWHECLEHPGVPAKAVEDFGDMFV